jgi:protocatechuate 3,4-dioxygenase beta subunit
VRIANGRRLYELPTSDAETDRRLVREHKWAFDAVTPGTVMGPYYPVTNKPRRAGTDLTRLPGRRAMARGRLLYVVGRLVDVSGRPIAGAGIEIWQANAKGRYSHPSDGNSAPLDRNFAGYGVTRTGADGEFFFRTIFPGGYPVVPGWDRAPHIHFLITGRRDRHVTQMWFPGHPLNQQDRLLMNLGPRERARLVARLESPSSSMEHASRVVRFDIVLTNG